MTDAERAVAQAELDAQLIRLKDARRRTADGLHELLNIMSVWQGEMDLVSRSARRVVEEVVKKLDDFYTRYPEFRD